MAHALCVPCPHAGFRDIVGKMRAILALGLAIPLCVCSQGLSGIVVDIDGKPIDGVRIDHTTMRYGDTVSDGEGHFYIGGQSPSVVLRKPGYQSQWVRRTPATDLRIVLQSESRKDFRTCGSLRKYEGIVNGRPGLYFLMADGVSANDPGSDIDYTSRAYSVKSIGGRKAIVHGSGPMWSLGIPSSTDVWASSEYSETGYGVPGIANGNVVILDARGKTAAGKLWRYVGMVGESASYRDVDETGARILDHVMDGACWLPPPHR